LFGCKVIDPTIKETKGNQRGQEPGPQKLRKVNGTVMVLKYKSARRSRLTPRMPSSEAHVVLGGGW
jgi:hypothetical protein